MGKTIDTETKRTYDTRLGLRRALNDKEYKRIGEKLQTVIEKREKKSAQSPDFELLEKMVSILIKGKKPKQDLIADFYADQVKFVHDFIELEVISSSLIQEGVGRESDIINGKFGLTGNIPCEITLGDIRTQIKECKLIYAKIEELLFYVCNDLDFAEVKDFFKFLEDYEIIWAQYYFSEYAEYEGRIPQIKLQGHLFLPGQEKALKRLENSETKKKIGCLYQMEARGKNFLNSKDYQELLQILQEKKAGVTV